MSQAERYKRADYTLVEERGHRTVFRTGSRTQSLPKQVHRLLGLCEKFRSLSGHAAVVQEALGLGERSTAEVRAALQVLALRGLLIAESQLIDAVRGDRTRPNTPPPPRIAFIGIPTADRPRLLRRCLRSYLDNAERHGREVTFVVVDDSKTQDAQDANATLVRSLRSRRVPVIYFGLPQRRAIVAQLQKLLGRAGDAVAFGLLPAPGMRITTGAARNAFLLLTAGSPVALIDDDTLATTCTLPGFRGDHVLAYSDSPSPYEYHFDTWRRLRRLPDVDLDWQASHERLLGRPVTECFRDPSFTELHLDELPVALASTLDAPGAVIRATTLGSRGDAGGSPLPHVLLASDAARASVSASKAVYRTAWQERRFLRASAAYAVGPARVSLGMNVGLDGTRLLPPFFPVLRNSDGIQGALLHAIGSYAGYAPYAVLHLPPPRVASLRRVDESAGRPFSSATEHILRLIPLDPVPGSTMEAAVVRIGTRLARLSGQPVQRFERHLRRLSHESLLQRRALVNRLLADTHSDAGLDPPSLAARVERTVEAGLRDRQLVVTDLGGRGGAREIAALQTLTARFGALLRQWPTLFEAARDVAKTRST
jgi:hypothetical protein